MEFHSLLKRQLKKCFPKKDLPPEINPFVEIVNSAYLEFDQDRNMLERSLEYSSQELFQANADMRAVIQAFPDIFSRVKESEERYRLLINLSPDGIFVQSEGKIVMVNKAFTALMDASSEEALLGKSMLDLLPPHYQGPVSDRLRHLEESKISLPWFEDQWMTLKKSLIDVEVIVSPFVYENKAAAQVVVRDITERRRLQNIVHQSEKMSAVGQLAAGLAHEIKNPLTVILGFVQSAVKQSAPGDRLEIPLRSIEREAQRCQQLIQDLLSFSRVDKRNLEKINLNESIESALLLVNAQAKIKNIEVMKDFHPELPPATVNRIQIQQVIINLCSNAMDAMAEDGKITLRTSVKKRNSKNFFEICVEDNGQGIPPEIQSKIFEPFFTTKEIGKGTGLGLSLVYEIVKKHDGEILLKSELGKGTAFVIYFPVDDEQETVK